MVSVVMEVGVGLPADAKDAPRDRLDLRLAVPAGAVWAGAALGGYWVPSRELLGCVAVVLAGCALAVLAGAWQRGGGPARAAAGPGRRLAGCVAVAFLAAGLLIGGTAGRARAVGPLAALVRAERTVEAVVVLTDDPKVSRPPAGATGTGAGGPGGAASTATARARLEAVTGPEYRVRAAVPVLLVGRAGYLAAYLPGQRLAVRATLAPPGPGETIAAVLFARAPPHPQGRPPMAQRAAGWLRARLRAAASVVAQPAGGLLPAMVVGDTSKLDPELKDDFRVAGLSHLTAVSGANAAIATGAVLVVLGRTRLGSRSRAFAAAAALVGFVILARPSASVVRAAAMGLVGLAALAAGRPRAVMAALATAVLAVIVLDPTFALSAGFALSVLATAGMVVWGPGWCDGIERRLAARRPQRSRRLLAGATRIAQAVAVAAAAQLACTPVLAWLGGGISLVAIPANVIAAPAVAPATLLGLLTMAVATLHPSAAELFARLAGLPCRWLVLVAGRAADLPGAAIGWPSGPLGAVAALAGVVLAIALARRPPTRRLLAAALASLLVARLFLVPRLAGWPPAGWRLVACDVGQGDGLVLRAGAGSAVVVDVGPDPELMATCLADLGVRRVPLLVLSHLHADHAAGLSGVLGRMPVGEMIVSPLPEPTEQWAEVERGARAAGVTVRSVLSGSAGASGTVGDVRWQVIGPQRVLRGTASDPNNASLVLLAEVGGVTMLLSGDAEPPEQRQVARAGAVTVDVLKVAHHGSADQIPEFLTGTGARAALISVGAGNTYGHPAAATLASLRAAGITVGRTDLHGAVAVVRQPSGRVALVARRPGRM
ncbi:competence protein ComEC [Parafrankia irregularis]|uniref:Competence protein ComEC n=1 Tax=Parafrankia irregularis TaxID=795642 RepID=A0A0S4QDV2_9ACTN|nr:MULTISPECIES: ComEC/Rec2 family competence protein [Parafrankia]MBE3199497.1 ComEC/Rec2 family competence protein [Parafrankia sp. CH37]CUU53840.1 competence protein ComEC [Parafrankia irregularis]